MAVGEVLVAGLRRGTAFLAGPGGIALTAAHLVCVEKEPPFGTICNGPVFLRLEGKQFAVEEILTPVPERDMAVLRLSETPEIAPLVCGISPPLQSIHPNYTADGFPSHVHEIVRNEVGHVTGRDVRNRLTLKPGLPPGMSGCPVTVAGVVVGIQVSQWQVEDHHPDPGPDERWNSGSAEPVDQFPAEIIEMLAWEEVPIERLPAPFAGRHDRPMQPYEPSIRVPVLLVHLDSAGHDLISIRRIRSVNGPESDLPIPPRPWPSNQLGEALIQALPLCKRSWMLVQGKAFRWSHVVCVFVVPDGIELPDLGSQSIYTSTLEQYFMCLAGRTVRHMGGATPERISLTQGVGHAFEHDTEDENALKVLIPDRLIGFFGVRAASLGVRRLLDHGNELALAVIQHSESQHALADLLQIRNTATDQPTFFQRLTTLRGSGQQLTVVWNDVEFLATDDDLLFSTGSA